MKNIVIFASGGGSNAREIIKYFFEKDEVNIALIISNNVNAGVLDIAKEYDIPSLLIDRIFFYKTENILKQLSKYNIEFIVLAGFLWKIPLYLVHQYKNRMLNIHPALLPKYGGKGMYGMNVHHAVWKAGETESGITIHQVNEVYDEGQIVFQAKCKINPTDIPKTIAKKVLKLEHQYFAPIIEKILKNL